jgi:hypothetical protein
MEGESLACTTPVDRNKIKDGARVLYWYSVISSSTHLLYFVFGVTVPRHRRPTLPQEVVFQQNSKSSIGYHSNILASYSLVTR